MLRWFFVVVLLTMGLSASATVVRFTVPQPGDYSYWFEVTDSDGTTRMTPPLAYSGKSAELDINSVSAMPQRVKLDVLDMKTGDLHVVVITGLKGNGTIIHKVSDFTRAWGVVLNVVGSNGKPVKSALVKLTDAANKDRFVVLTPQDRGKAIFREISAGQVRVTVEGSGIDSVDEPDFEVPRGRGLVPFTHTVKVSGSVGTLEAASSDSEDNGESKPEGGESKQSLPAILMQNLLGLILLVIIVVVGYMVLKNRGVTVADTLKKAGVTLPNEEAAAQVVADPVPAEPAVDPNICPFCGGRKDANGNCACTLGGAPAAVQAPLTPGKLRLVGKTGVYAGYVFELSSGSTIGRDTSNTIALPNDSAVSRQHASLAMDMSGATLADLGSSNGTLVNGLRIATPTILKPGDEVQIGQTRFRLEA